jgi:hypothetical protein
MPWPREARCLGHAPLQQQHCPFRASGCAQVTSAASRGVLVLDLIKLCTKRKTSLLHAQLSSWGSCSCSAAFWALLFETNTDYTTTKPWQHFCHGSVVEN